MLATNVAETSLTVPGIRYVVDTGLARVSRFSRRLKVQRLPIEKVSQASEPARRACGQVADGICIRLYAEDDFDARPEFTDPEILRTNLASVILQMIALDLGDLAAFPFVDKPDLRAVGDGLALLNELGALEHGHRTLTAVGRALDVARRPSAGPHARRGRPDGLPARGADHHRGAVDPGPARASHRAAPGRRRQARPLRSGRLGLCRLPQALGVRAGAARRAHRQPVPQAAARGVSALPAHPRVAGPARPAAPPRATRG